MAGINFSNEEMSALVSKAIIEGLGDDQRNLLIKQAIESLMTVDNRDSYGRDKRNRLQIAFDEAVVNHARRVASEELAKDENVAKLHSLVAEAIERLFTGDVRADVIEAMVKGMTELMRKAAGY